MLKKDTLMKIAGILKMDPATFEAAVSDAAEKDVEIPELLVFSKTELESRDKNLKSTSYNEGKTAGEEILIKGAKEKFGLDFEGKSSDNLFEAYSKKVLADAKIEPSKALGEKDSIIAKLQGNITALEAEKTALAGQMDALGTTTRLHALIPTEGRKVKMSNDEIVGIMGINGITFKTENGAVVPYQNGQVMRDDKTQNVMEAGSVITNFMKAKEWLGEADQNRTGRGGGNSTPGGNPVITKLSEAQKKWESDGKSANTKEFFSYVQGLQKEAGEAFDMNG